MKRRKAGEDGDTATASRGSRGAMVAQIRTRVAQVVWLLFVVAALFLAIGALCVALDFNQRNDLVGFALDGADFFDLDIFSRRGGLKTFRGDGAETKNALFNWGIGAVVYLIVGRIVDRLIRP